MTKTLRSVLSAAALALFAGTALAPAAQAFQPQVWFGSVDPVVQGDRHVGTPADFMELFSPNAPWQATLSGLSVFKVSTQFILRGSNEELQSFFSFVRAHNLAVDIELGLLVWSDRCGKGFEGYGGPNTVVHVLDRVRQVGGRLDYVDMDEPVTIGHAKTGKGSHGVMHCNDPIESLASQVAPKIKLIRSYFPNVKVGEIDALWGTHPEQVGFIVAFNDAVYRATGVRPSYVNLDINWTLDWREVVERVTAQLHARGVRVGVVFDCDNNVASDQQCVAQSVSRFRQFAATPSLRPDNFVFQTWTAFPHRVLPETDPGAWTYAARTAVASLRR